MPAFEDWLKDPLSIINNIFNSDQSNFESKVQEYFENKLNSEKNYYSIPCINDVPIHELTPNCLVRYRCMIQDSFDPVYYTRSHQLQHIHTKEVIQFSLKYKETINYPENFEIIREHINVNLECDLHQRLTFYCVPIPGETEWVKQMNKSIMCNSIINSAYSIGSSSNTSHRPEKRDIDCMNESSKDENSKPVTQLDGEAFPTVLNTISTENSMQTAEKNVCKTCSKEMRMLETRSNLSKKSKTKEASDDKPSKNNFNLNFPLATKETGTACLVKVYDSFDEFKLNDMVEFVGILSQDPSLAYMYDEHSFDSQQQQQNRSIEDIKADINLESMDTGTSADQKEAPSTFCECAEASMRQKQANEASSNPGSVLSSYPPSLVPRLHCIKSYHLEHNNPLIKKVQSKSNEKYMSLTDEIKSNEKENKQAYWIEQYKTFLAELGSTPSDTDAILTSEHSLNCLRSLRTELISCFQELLLGDCLAAEYLLMNLISSVFMRKDVTILGKFALNIFNIPSVLKQGENESSKPKQFVESFYNAISEFLTNDHLFNLTIENLNKSNLIPNKDYNKDKLISGILQLPENFTLLIDETSLNSGELNPKGLLNFNSIKDIIKWQRLMYDFSYHQQEFPTNIRILTLSESKSILPFDCQLKLKSEKCFDDVMYEQFMNGIRENKRESKLLNMFRKYLTIISQLDYKLTPDMQKIIEDDIVQIRKTSVCSNNYVLNNRKDKLCADDFHLMLVVARLQCISYGKTELSVIEWNAAKRLEFERFNNRL